MTITLNLPPEMEEEVRQAAQTQGKEVPVFLLDSVRRQLRHDVLSESDTDLLEIINSPIAPEARRERDSLLATKGQRDLTEAEKATLTQLINTVELADARRWQSIAELARRRGLSLADIAQELEIPLV